MRFVAADIIEIFRELSDLDKFTIDFVSVLERHTDYVIVSGYVSILLGRARASEDVDLIIPKMNFREFSRLLDELNRSNFYCLNAEKYRAIYSYLEENVAIRFARIETAIPNIELKFAKNAIDQIALNKKIKVKLAKNELIISHLELQIAFKEVVLKSQKDIEDARHIRNVAKGHLDMGLIKKYEVMLVGI